jgi:Outer membrane protein beta-barrel domain
MLKRLFFTILTLIVLAGSNSVFAQDKENMKDNPDTVTQDSTNTSGRDKNSDNDWHHFKVNFELFDSYFTHSPSVSLTYGFSSMSIHNFSGSFAEPNIPEIKLGYSSGSPIWSADEIINYKYNYLYLSNITTDISGTAAANEIQSNLWRFGIGIAQGYGYRIGSSSAIIPYNSFSLGWSRLDVKNFPSNPVDANKLSLFNDAFRFGTGSEAGVRIKVIPLVNVEVGYERSIIFERHLFWKWAGSALIEAGGNWALEAFVDKIMDSSPYAAPIVGFVLKGALAYGIYELRHEKMNWPFESAAPLAYDQFKFGLTFNF